MAFTKEPARAPAAIGDVVLVLRDLRAEGATPASQQAAAEIEVLDASGGVIRQVRVADLFAHLTAGQATTLRNFLTTLRNKAAAEIL